MANFLELPPELRNEIYKLVIKTGKTINLEDHPQASTICHVNQQIRSEALSVWRGCNRFILDVNWQSHFQAPAFFLWHLRCGFDQIQYLTWTDSSTLSVGSARSCEVLSP